MSVIIKVLSLYLSVAVLLSIYSICYARTKGNSPVVTYFSLLTGSLSLFIFGYLMEINSQTLEQLWFWNGIQYLALPFYPAFWLMLGLVYTGKAPAMNRLHFLLIYSVPALTFLIRQTNDFHFLYYRDYYLTTEAGFPVLFLEKGPWYWVFSAYIIVTFSLTTFLYIQKVQRSNPLKKKAYQLLLTASLLPFAGFLLILLDPWRTGLDYTALVLPVALYLLFLGLTRYDLLSIRALARETIFEKSDDAMIVTDEKLNLIDYNPAALQVFPELKNIPYMGEARNILFKHKALEELCFGDKHLVDLSFPDISPAKHYEVRRTLFTDPGKNEIGNLWSFSDISARKEAEMKLIESKQILEVMATTDDLTKLYNRKAYFSMANELWENSILSGDTFFVFLIDLDHFKNINDTFGHSCGDRVLEKTALILEESFSSSGICGRIGGEEFSGVLVGYPQEKISEFAEILRSSIEKFTPDCEGCNVKVTASIGISIRNPQDSGDTFEKLLSEADSAMYASKKAGRNCWTIFEK